jgi:hypothetical protein
MKKQLTILLLAMGLASLTGCAAIKSASATVRTAVNKSLDVVDKSIETADKTINAAVSGAKETTTPVTSSQ